MDEKDASASGMPGYWLPDRVYDVLKWVGLLALPTLAWAYQALAGAWGLPYAEQVPMTLNICGTAVAVLIGASELKARGGGDGTE